MSHSIWLVQQLLTQGISLDVDAGRLIAVDWEGTPIELEPEQPNQIVQGLGMLFGVVIVQYKRYSIKRTQTGKKIINGVTLHFSNVVNGPESPYKIFNAVLHHTRSNQKKRAGDPLPAQQFTLQPDSKLVRLWETCRLRKPASLTRYWERMGKLKPLYFAATIHAREPNRLEDIRPLTLLPHEILDALTAFVTHNQRINTAQLPHKQRITETHKEMPPAQQPPALPPIPSAGAFSHSQTVNRTQFIQSQYQAIKDGALVYKPPQHQTVDEWLNDYSQS